MEYISHLWGNKELRFGANPDDGVIGAQVTVSTEVSDVQPADYKGIIAIGAYAMDRLRYQVSVRRDRRTTRRRWPSCAKREPLRAEARHDLPLAVAVLADPDLLKGRKVTCAHNIICDVENAGGDVVFEAT